RRLRHRRRLLLEQIGASLIRDGDNLAEREIETAREDGAKENRRDEAIEADARRLGRGDLRVSREAADREYGREQHGRREYHEHRVREPVDVAHDDVLPRQIAAEILVEIIGEIDDDE